MHVEPTINVAHLLGVIKNQRNEDVDGALVGEPEPERISAETDLVEQVNEQDPRAKGHRKPDDQNLGEQAERGFPVGMTAFVFLHEIPSFVSTETQRYLRCPCAFRGRSLGIAGLTVATLPYSELMKMAKLTPGLRLKGKH
jgi:hypothetical protein